MTDSDEPEYGLVLPFTVCVSQGGPYEDAAFCAGFAAGRIDTLLMSNIEFEGPVRRDLLPQLDLIAMRYGFGIDMNPETFDPDGEWAQIHITKVAIDGG